MRPTKIEMLIAVASLALVQAENPNKILDRLNFGFREAQRRTDKFLESIDEYHDTNLDDLLIGGF